MRNQLTYNYYPGGKTKAVTMSFDDGRMQDRRLVELFNQYGIKGTFHLNSQRLGQDGFVTAEELHSLYKDHEIAIHSYNHPTIAYMPPQQIYYEVAEDKRQLEKMTKQVICGMSYPNGSFGPNVTAVLKTAGVLYSRTTRSNGKFVLPENFLEWHPTIHYSRGVVGYSPDVHHSRTVLLETAKQFADHFDWVKDMPILYVWGHSYELDDNQNWDVMEDFCRYISQFGNIWFAQNIEVVNYVQALKSLRVSTDCDIVYNPSATDVWIGVNNSPVKIPAGTTVVFD